MIDTSKITIKTTRKEIHDLFGEPTNKSVTTKKRKIPSVYRYNNIEIGFTEKGTSDNHTVFYVMDVGNCKTQHNMILSSRNNNENSSN